MAGLALPDDLIMVPLRQWQLDVVLPEHLCAGHNELTLTRGCCLPCKCPVYVHRRRARDTCVCSC